LKKEPSHPFLKRKLKRKNWTEGRKDRQGEFICSLEMSQAPPESSSSSSSLLFRRGWRAPLSADSPGFVGKKFAAHCDLDAIAFRVRDSFDIHRKIDGAHDPISELLVDQFLDRLAVD
jgi:hypothetical protein